MGLINKVDMVCLSPVGYSVQLNTISHELMRDWRIKYGQSVPQKTVRNMSTKDNPDTLPINLYAHEEPTATPLDFTNLTEDVAKPVGHNHSIGRDSLHCWRSDFSFF